MMRNQAMQQNDEHSGLLYSILSDLFHGMVRCVVGLCKIRAGRIFLSSMGGLEPKGNPGYIGEYLTAAYPGKYELIQAEPYHHDDPVLRRIPCTIRNEYYRLTSACVIEDSIPVFVHPKRSQLCIDTWHGGGYYKVVRPSAHVYDGIDCFLSSSRQFSSLLTEQWRFHGTILPSGLPRNDLIFSPPPHIRKKVMNALNLSGRLDLILYTPTWRDESDGVAVYPAMADIRDAYKQRFKKDCVILIRGHYNMPLKDVAQCILVNDYPDVQELLACADLLISDYSSIIWDYSFLYRPCLLFTPDLDWYIENRGLETDIHTWGFPVCMNNEQLVNAILSFDADKYRRAMEEHHDDLGSYETGHACEQVAALIHEFCSLKNRDRVRMKKALRTGQYDLTRIGHNFIP